MTFQWTPGVKDLNLGLRFKKIVRITQIMILHILLFYFIIVFFNPLYQKKMRKDVEFYNSFIWDKAITLID